MPGAVRRLLLVAVLGVMVASATGCDVSPPAATVNGTSISQSTLNDALSSAIDNPDAQCAAMLAVGLTTTPVGVGTKGDGSHTNAVTSAFADKTLETLILEALERQTIAAHHATVSGAVVAAATADYEAQLGEQLSEATQENTTPPGCALSASKAVAGQLPAPYLAQAGRSLADQEQFEVTEGHVDVSTAGLEAYYRSHQAQTTQVCINAYVSDTAAGAQTLHDAIAAGASFASLATSPAVDLQRSPPDGNLPCEYPSSLSIQIGSSLEAQVVGLATGQLAEPLQLPNPEPTAGQPDVFYLVIQMRARQLVPFATLRGSIRQAILEQHASVVDSALDRLVRRAHVTVDARYGTWDPKRGVTVPTPPSPAFVPNPKANVAAASSGSSGLTITPAPG